jgi:hypothetical protein
MRYPKKRKKIIIILLLERKEKIVFGSLEKIAPNFGVQKVQSLNIFFFIFLFSPHKPLINTNILHLKST